MMKPFLSFWDSREPQGVISEIDSIFITTELNIAIDYAIK